MLKKICLFSFLVLTTLLLSSSSYGQRRRDPAPTGVKSGGTTTSFLTKGNFFYVRTFGTAGEFLFDHIKYGIETFSRQPQNLRNQIVGKTIHCRGRGTRYFCEFLMDVNSGEMLPFVVSKIPYDREEVGRHRPKTKGKGTIGVMYEPSIDMPHTLFTLIKGNTSLAFFQAISRSNKVERIEDGGLRVTNGRWVCYKHLLRDPDHCKAYIDLEIGDFKVADPDGPTSRLFFYYYLGMTPEGAVIWN